ncbi:hypothetical protein Pth03_32000 [Planotetraspora thailandica]|uniref:Uncharacterized protein n=1 Tax=Planotetraspora thailandica TaxID=487172 RepID=A0A8J3V4F3_9ACTN|nr:hypothetical protein [Planotetraspora thailandica]GII54811.1 hypothetical protein Pth03_32000 [Planotetraspora thailandica]
MSPHDEEEATAGPLMGAKGYHNPMYEQDNAPGGTANPAQSLQYSELSYDNMAALRG